MSESIQSDPTTRSGNTGVPDLSIARDLDEDGYPTDELLLRIRTWPYTAGHHGLMELVRVNWHWDNYFEREGKFYKLSTGGWSGHEALVGALQDNHMFWALCWVSSKRGGHHVFEVEDRKTIRHANVTGAQKPDNQDKVTP